jgi:hypothetical protein
VRGDELGRDEYVFERRQDQRVLRRLVGEDLELSARPARISSLYGRAAPPCQPGSSVKLAANLFAPVPTVRVVASYSARNAPIPSPSARATVLSGEAKRLEAGMLARQRWTLANFSAVVHDTVENLLRPRRGSGSR